MQTGDWTGQIMCNKKRNRIVNFRAEPDLVEQLQKVENKSKLIREAVREKLKNLPESYLISKTEMKI